MDRRVVDSRAPLQRADTAGDDSTEVRVGNRGAIRQRGCEIRIDPGAAIVLSGAIAKNRSLSGGDSRAQVVVRPTADHLPVLARDQSNASGRATGNAEMQKRTGPSSPGSEGGLDTIGETHDRPIPHRATVGGLVDQDAGAARARAA